MKRKRNPESGYAMLMIFAMAAILAITLYTEVPRVAFEAQRDKEQLLIDRGEEYQRAVTLFVHKFNRFPASMEELENTNNQRFLRRRFVDPMTGKADWRLVHAGPGGVLTDSVDNKPKTDDKGQGTQQNFITDLGVTASSFNQADLSAGTNIATRRRPSDSGTGAGGAGDDSGNQQPSNTGIPGYNGPVMVLPDGRIVPANSTGTYTPPTGAAGASGRITPMPGMGLTPGGTPPTGITPGGLPPGAPGAVPGQINNGLQPMMPGGVAVQQGMPQGSAAPGGPPGTAAALINQILTSPRGGGPGAPAGAGPVGSGVAFTPPAAGQTTTTSGLQSSAQQQQQNVIGAGIAGVASKNKGEGIKTVNDHTKYNEWEFVYDVTKDPARVGAGMAGAAGASGAQGGATPQGVTPTMGAQPGAMTPGTSSGIGRGGSGQ
ncbi:MAG TPA: hypothetical protein VHC90_07070 [Bryobacteraceae bacterium]|nr:hypothetical protein [Bryobacteraceae bacterium]